jgi:predicted DNA-binding transcriptional regulator AlpA
MSLPKLLRFKDLHEHNIAKSREQLRTMQEDYGFPLGRWMTPNVRVWTEEEVNTWLESRPIATENKKVNLTDRHISRRLRKQPAEAM